MEGYRLALNLSYLPQTSEGINASDLESCDSQDDVETSAVLVSTSCAGMSPDRMWVFLWCIYKHLFDLTIFI